MISVKKRTYHYAVVDDRLNIDIMKRYIFLQLPLLIGPLCISAAAVDDSTYQFVTANYWPISKKTNLSDLQ